MMIIDANLLLECKKRLVETKMDLLNRVHNLTRNLLMESVVRDDADQLSDTLNEAQTLTHMTRLRGQLFEVESALARIEYGRFGVCEETEDLIEERRLRAIPWTRFSTEGAEIQERKKVLHFRGS